MANDFKVEGYVAANGSLRVTVREPGRGWHQSANHTLDERQTRDLIESLKMALIQAQEMCVNAQ